MVEAEVGVPAQSNLYLTPPSAQGFEVHWDPMETIVAQVLHPHTANHAAFALPPSHQHANLHGMCTACSPHCSQLACFIVLVGSPINHSHSHA